MVGTHNDLVGVQIGSDWFYQDCRWRFGVRGKAGPYFNFADQSSLVTQQTATPIPDRNESAAHQDSLAFVGEVNLMGAYQIRPNMALRASYDLMWINNVALAPNQVNFVITNPPIVRMGGAPFYQAIRSVWKWSGRSDRAPTHAKRCWATRYRGGGPLPLVRPGQHHGDGLAGG